MIRNTYEKIQSSLLQVKLNEKLDDLLSIPKDSKCITIDNDIFRHLNEITAKYNSLLMEVINRNTMIEGSLAGEITINPLMASFNDSSS